MLPRFIYGPGLAGPTRRIPTSRSGGRRVVSNHYDTSYSVVVKVDDNVEPYLHIEQDGGLLRIYLENDINYEHTTCKASITSPSLASLAVGDSAHAKVAGFVGAMAMAFRAADSSKIALEGLDAQRVTVHVADSSAVEGDVTCNGLEFDVADSSEVTLEGTARSVDLQRTRAPQGLPL